MPTPPTPATAEHWLTHVIAGLVVGWTWFLLVVVILGGRLQRFGERAEPLAPAADVASIHENGARDGI